MIDTIKYLAYIIGSSQQEVEDIASNSYKYYSSYWQAKMKYGRKQIDDNGNVKKRHVTPSRYRLKVLQQNINAHILSKITIPEYAYGSIRGKSNLKNAYLHLGNKYFFSVDLKDFFPRINNRQVFRMFRENDFSPSVSRLLTQLTTFNGCLPQGAPTSPAIANIVFIPTGNRLLDIAKQHDITFTTHLDDLNFSSHEDFKNLTPTILEIIKEGAFFPSHKKIHYKTQAPEITGILLAKNSMYLPLEMRIRAKSNPDVKNYQDDVRYYNKLRKKS